MRLNVASASAGARVRRVAAGALGFLRARGWALAYILLAAAILLAVGSDAFGTRLVTFYPGSDYWEHTATLRALMESPLHPHHPMLVSSAIAPRFGPHFVLLALFGRSFGLDVFATMGVGIVLNTLIFLVGAYLFFKSYFRDERAPLYALVVLFGSWFDAPHYSNVYKLSVYFSVAGYPSTAALGVMLLGLTLTLKLLREAAPRPWHFGLLAFVWAYVYVTHPLTAALAFTATGLLALTEPGVAWRRRGLVLGAVFVGLVLTLLWPYYPALSMVARTTAGRVQDEISSSGGRTTVHAFYSKKILLATLGSTLVVVPFLPYLLVRRRHLFVPLGALLMLAVFLANFYVRIPLGHRFLLLAIFFLQVGVVWLLLALTPRGPALPRWAARLPVRVAAAVAVASALAVTAYTNVAAARARFRTVPRVRESLVMRAGRNIAAKAGPNAVILGDPTACWALPTFGPRIVALHHGNMIVADAEQRLDDAGRFFSSPDDKIRSPILARYGATHVLVDRRGARRAASFLAANAKLVLTVGSFRLYAVDSKAAPSAPSAPEPGEKDAPSGADELPEDESGSGTDS